MKDVNTPILTVQGLQKYFPVGQFGLRRRYLRAVEDVSFSLYPGKVTALVGESGSGKTTVARVLARIYDPTSGKISLDGQDAGAIAPRAYRRKVQMIFQDPFSSLNPATSIAYTLSRPLVAHGHATFSNVHQFLPELLQRVSLTPAEQFLKKHPHELSGGQRQRVAIARALAVQPEILLADEPVSMLDVSIRLDILNLMTQLKEEEKLAILFITHDIASARYFAEETLVMYAGQMVEGGSSEEVTQQPKHPYTQLLLSAAPDPDRLADPAAEIPVLPARGEIPSLVNPPSGCRFHPRCPLAMDVCKERFPQRTNLENGHWVHCHHVQSAE